MHKSSARHRARWHTCSGCAWWSARSAACPRDTPTADRRRCASRGGATTRQAGQWLRFCTPELPGSHETYCWHWTQIKPLFDATADGCGPGVFDSGHGDDRDMTLVSSMLSAGRHTDPWRYKNQPRCPWLAKGCFIRSTAFDAAHC